MRRGGPGSATSFVTGISTIEQQHQRIIPRREWQRRTDHRRRLYLRLGLRLRLYLHLLRLSLSLRQQLRLSLHLRLHPRLYRHGTSFWS